MFPAGYKTRIDDPIVDSAAGPDGWFDRVRRAALPLCALLPARGVWARRRMPRALDELDELDELGRYAPTGSDAQCDNIMVGPG
jgi:hypothetical protein